MGVNSHLQSFAGHRIIDEDPKTGFNWGPPGTVAYCGREESDSDDTPVLELLTSYLAEEGSDKRGRAEKT